jgi:AraC-like DNA-binding protein/quercetin dioxygenase-like cupin family protein
MPFYHFDQNGHTDSAGFSSGTVPRAIVAIGGVMVTKGKEIPVHAHRKAQLVMTVRGTIRCEAEQNVWMVPPRCAVWLPSYVPHSLTFAGDVEAHVLYVEPGSALSLPKSSCVLSISPLLEQMLLHATTMPVLYAVDGSDGRFATVLLDRLSLAPVEKLNLPMPLDHKLRKIAKQMMADPSDRMTMDDWAKRASISPRTLARILQRETGMSFGRWRQQLILLFALERLTQGASVQKVAIELGYQGTSAFVTMFRKAIGKPPVRYLAERRLPFVKAAETEKGRMAPRRRVRD